jgi:molybdopterin synthase sulfur carrier subunit
MKVKAFATLRDLLGWKVADIPVDPAATVEDVLAALAAGNPEFAAKLWNEDRKLTGIVTVLLNGRAVQYLKGIQTSVTESDVISLFPPVGGG